MIFDVNGEYGYELQSVAPLVNYYHNKGVDVVVNSHKGSSFIYPNIEVNEIHSTRQSFLELNVDGESYYRRHNHSAGMWSRPIVGDKMFYDDKWLPPDLKGYYSKKYSLEFDKPLLIISNKIQNEWDMGPVNYYDLETLKGIFDLCSDKFTIIYNRPNIEDIVNDETKQLSFGDKSLCEENGIVTIQNMMDEYDMSFNEIQMALYSNCEHFVSTQGGNSVLAAYFGGKNIIYAVRGYEVKWDAYNTWFHKLSNQNVYHSLDYKNVIDTIKKEFINE